MKKGSSRCALALVLAAAPAVAALARPDGESEPLAPAAVKPLEKLAHEIAKGGRAEELDELLDVVRRCGMDADSQQKLASVCRQELARVRKTAPTLPSTAKSLQKAAADLAPRLDELEPDGRGSSRG